MQTESRNSAENSCPYSDNPALFCRVMRAMFVVPETQVHILDFSYQLYTFLLFHKVFVNRLSHYIGIPIAMVCMYVFLHAYSGAAGVFFGCVLGIHLALAFGNGFKKLIPLLLSVHVFLWIASLVADKYWFSQHTEWFHHPIFYAFICSLFQYLTHLLEKTMPSPFSKKENFIEMINWLKTAGLKDYALAIMLVPNHIFVEWVSGPRNLFLIILRAANVMGYQPINFSDQVKKMNQVADDLNAPLYYKSFNESEIVNG